MIFLVILQSRNDSLIYQEFLSDSASACIVDYCCTCVLQPLIELSLMFIVSPSPLFSDIAPPIYRVQSVRCAANGKTVLSDLQRVNYFPRCGIKITKKK